MDGSFCQGEPLWDYQLAWNTTSPRLTQCFQKTIPVWIPAIFVWLFGPLDIYYILSRHRMRGPSSAAAVIVPNFYNITRLVLVGLIVALNLVKFSYDVYYFFNPDPIYLPTIAAVVASAINLFSFALFGILINIHRQYGVHTSSIAWLFTFLEFILSLPVLYMFLAFYGDNEVLIDPYRTGFKEWNFVEAVIFCGHFMALTFVFVMTCFADQRSARRAPSVESLRNVAEKEENGVAMRSLLINGSRSKIAVSKSPECPSLSASFFSDMTYWWFNSMAYLGFKKTLQLEDLWELNPEDLTVNITPQFDHNWNGNSASAEAPPKVVSSDNSDVEFAQNCQEGGTVTATCRTFGFYLLGTVLFKFVHDCLQFVSPQLLKLFIEFISKSVDVEPVWHGVFIAVCFFVVSTVQSVLLNKYFHLLYSVQMRIRSALISKIYRKSLELANSSRKESTSGEIVNLMSVDAQKFVDLFPFINLVWSAPFQIILTIVFLWAELGPSVLAGLAVMILLMPLNAWLSTYQRKLQIVQMKKKDERVKVVNEVLNGIKVIKLYGWEVPFINKLNLIRGAEISNLMKISYVSAVTSFLWTCAPFMVSFVSFAIYILSSTENVLDAKKAFVSLSLFNLLRFPLTMLPPMITSLVMASVSIKRLNRFLNSPQLEDYVHREDIDGDAIRISGGHFKWEMGKTDKSKESEVKKENSKPQENGNTEQDKLLNDVEANGKGNAENKFKDFQLKGVDLKIKKGSLVAIVGRVGSGKSSLLSAILGNMERKDGTVTLNKSSQMAYVAQQAWIQNATLKENILFGNVPNPTKYKHVIDICALKPDISILPGGDQTEIGEKGINLSGGQKQRVAIARACYSDSNVILMDDPLSAVDSHVARHIFGHVISNQTGFLKDRTRVLVTNQISFLSEMDQIVVMVDGAITEVGTYDDLIAKSGKFSEFVKEYANDSREESENEDEFSNEENSPVRERTLSKIRERSISISSTKGSNSGTLGRSKSQKEEQEEQKLIEAERAETGNVKFSIYLTYFRSLTFLWLSIMLVGFVGMQVASVYSNIWLALWSNDHKTYNGTQEDIELRNQRLYVYGCLGFLQALFVLFGALAMARGTIYSSRTLHRGLLNRIMRAPMSFFDTTPLGRIVNRFAKDIDTVDSTIPHNLRGWLICFLQVISTFILISYEVPVFLFVAVVVLTIYYYIQKFYVATSRQLKRLESITRSPIYSHFGETLSGVFTIRAFGASKKFIEESNKRVDTNQRCFFPSFIANRWLALRLEFCGNLIVFSATGFAVFYRESFQSQPGFAGLIITYALSVTSTLNWLVRMTSEIETNVVSVERIDEYCNIESEREWNRTVNADPHIPDGWPSEGGIKFENYSVRYRQELDLVLNGLSLNIKPHEKIGIVGRTGSGKSTTTLALFRILESSAGRIQIDDIDISKIGLHELRSKISIIPQDPVLFSGTIRSNLDPFETYGDADLWEALEHAHLKSYVSTLEQGLDYPVAENGENLSLGQRQLVCLGRALLRKNQVRVIVLDEATAAVDLETDSLIQNTIRSEFTDCTILTIAHRLNTILDSDRVLVLDHGKIEEFDSPKNLLADRKSRFYALAKDARIV